jgi:anti-anti-sigma factor
MNGFRFSFIIQRSEFIIQGMTEQPYKIRQKMVNDVVVVEVTGRLDPPADGRDGLLALVEQRLQEGYRNFLLNLNRIRMVSSLGVGGLINLLRVVVSHNGALKLLQPSFSVRHILRISKLEDLFETFQDEAVAVSSFAQAETAKSPVASKKSRTRRATKEGG